MELPTLYQQFIHRSRYARWLPSEGRRETWPETVDRYVDFMSELAEWNPKLKAEIRASILNLEVMPSMRALMTAGPALTRDNVAGFNCAYLPIEHPRCFDELFYILLCGTGVGFSVEQQYTSKLPEVNEMLEPTNTVILVHDSKIGWAKALRELISMLYAGHIPSWDLSKVRPAGAVLKTFGGRASGPEPLNQLLQQIINIFNTAAGRKLTNKEVHDICCHIAAAVVVGGVRRSALISLSDLTDYEMRSAKSGDWYNSVPHRALANNSAIFNARPTASEFTREWLSLIESRSGERGIFNRNACKIPERREEAQWGTNPCSEIILRPYEFCNLTEVVARNGDGRDTLKRKIRIAAILGVAQSLLTNFRYLRKIWQRNCVEERLLGVSITGITDCPGLTNGLLLSELREYTNKIAFAEAKRLNVNPPAATTCVKPSGTVSQLVNASSGIHDRFAPHYIRRVRQDIKDPMTQFLIDQNIPHEPDVNAPEDMVVFSFPIAAPKGVEIDPDEIRQLERWKIFQTFWCEHKPSCTILIRDDKWLEVGAWVYEHFDAISGISFLPRSNHIYPQAPYEAITQEQYDELNSQMPKSIEWTALVENLDHTTSSQEFACVGGSCEI